MKTPTHIALSLIVASALSESLVSQGYTSSITHSAYEVESIYDDSCSGCSSFYRFWLNPFDPTEDVTIDCSFGPTAPHRFDLDHQIVSYLQYVRTETWADYDHVLRATNGHVAGALILSVNGLGWGAIHADFLGDGSWEWWNGYNGTTHLPVIFGSRGLKTRLQFYYDESAWSYNYIEFDELAPTVFASEGAECGGSMSAIFDPDYSEAHFECGGMPLGSLGAFVVGINDISLPIPLSGCVLGTDLLSVIPTVPSPGRGSVALTLPVPQSPVAFRVQHLHIQAVGSNGSMAVMASNTLRVDIQ